MQTPISLVNSIYGFKSVNRSDKIKCNKCLKMEWMVALLWMQQVKDRIQGRIKGPFDKSFANFHFYKNGLT